MKTRSSIVLSVFMLTALFVAAETASAAIIRVSPGGDDAHSGASWALAKKTVQAAVDAAIEGDEIWVAAGTYPEHVKNKVLNEEIDPVPVNIALYGGFAGTETARAQRNWLTNLTVLDGGGGAAPSPPAVGSVVHISGGAGRATRIDGFVITKGHAIGGGGILIEGSGPTIVNNNIWANSAGIGGGIGVSNYDFVPPTISQPVITDNKIFGNSAGEGGGGIAVIGAARLVSYDPAAPIIARNVISQNSCVANGGGIGCWGHTAAYIADNFIVANSAATDESSFAGGGGGIFATSRDLDDEPISYAICAPVIINNSIAANGGYIGAGIHCWDTDGEHGGIPIITNNTIVSNNGIGIYWRVSSPVMTNNLVAFNPWGLQQPADGPTSPTISHNCIYGNSVRGKRTDYNGIADQTGTNGNISIDPLFANVRIGDIRIQPGSPCVNAGTSSAVSSDWKDIQGEDRIQGNGVDIGADESNGTSWDIPTPVIHVRTGGSDAEDGTTWAKAKKTVAAGLTAAFLGGGGEVWVAEGTYVERNFLYAFTYLYGGFAGTETSRAQRDIAAHPTILDGAGVPNVITVGKAGFLTSAIDGFTIRNGGTYTNGAYPFTAPRYAGRGGGIDCRLSSPSIENNIITHNSVGDPIDSADYPGYGGGLYIYMFFGLIRGNTFTENEVLAFDGEGGAIRSHFSMPTIQGNSFTANHAPYGTAISATLSMPDIIGNTIENNTMYILGSLYSGATYGAIYLYQNEDFLIQGNTIKGNTAASGAGIAATTNSAGKILNNLVVNNIAQNAYGYSGMGGGMYLLVQDSATDNLVVADNTVVGNTATTSFMPYPQNEQGGGIALTLLPALPPPPQPPPAKLVMANNIIAFNSSGVWQNPTVPMPYPTLVKNDVYGSTSGTNCNYIYVTAGATDISLNPSIVSVGTGDYHILSASPCKDAGDNSQVPSVLTADLDGNPRIIDGNADGTAVVDMGAYEFTSGTDTTAPSVTITSPTSNAAYVTSLAVIDLGGTASDNVGITGVTWSNDRGGGGTCDGTANWTASDILLFIGQNVITVTARDHTPGGNTGTDIITITYTLPVTVSGYVKTPGGSGISGVIMDGLPSTPSTDATGFYADTAVPSGWSGTVTPLKFSLSFTPPTRAYSDVLIDQVNQDFTGTGGFIQPELTTAAATCVTSTTATSGGDVISDGGAAVTARGVCWNLVPNPTISNSHTEDGTGTGSFASSITGLIPGFTYYVRAYATNSVGTSYGNEVHFTMQTKDYVVPFNETFTSPARPADWTVQVVGAGVEDPWLVGLTNYAGGTANEMRARYEFAQGTVRLVTPPINTTGHQTLAVSFRHLLNTWDVGGVTLSIQTSPDGVIWTNEAWSVLTDVSNIGPAVVRTTLAHNLDRKTTYVAFVMEGDLFNFEDWFIDDVSVGSRSLKVDFNKDGQEDLLWRCYGTGYRHGDNVVWFMTQTGALSPMTLGSTQNMAGAMNVLTQSTPAKTYLTPMDIGNVQTSGPGRSYISPMDVGNVQTAGPRRSLASPMDVENPLAPGQKKLTRGKGVQTRGRELQVDPVLQNAEKSFAGDIGTMALGYSDANLYTVLDTAWEIAGAGDFDGDGNADILWRYYGAGQGQGTTIIWFMTGTTITSQGYPYQISDLDWKVDRTGDFNGDGKTDILWRYYGTGPGQGTTIIWYMNGANVIGQAYPPQVWDTDWRIDGIGDFNGDGKADLLWRYYRTGPGQGTTIIWYMDGATIIGQDRPYLISDTDWRIDAVGDFDGDGKADIVWRYYGTVEAPGTTIIWYMNGATIKGQDRPYRVPDLNWKIVNR